MDRLVMLLRESFVCAVGYIVLSHRLHTNHLDQEYQDMKSLWVNSTSQTVLLHQLNYGGSLSRSQKHRLISSMVCILYAGLAAHISDMVLQFTCNWYFKLALVLSSLCPSDGVLDIVVAFLFMFIIRIEICYALDISIGFKFCCNLLSNREYIVSP